MSAILGPIHHWLFRKIKIQNDLTNAIIEGAIFMAGYRIR